MVRWYQRSEWSESNHPDDIFPVFPPSFFSPRNRNANTVPSNDLAKLWAKGSASLDHPHKIPEFAKRENNQICIYIYIYQIFEKTLIKLPNLNSQVFPDTASADMCLHAQERIFMCKIWLSSLSPLNAILDCTKYMCKRAALAWDKELPHKSMQNLSEIKESDNRHCLKAGKTRRWEQSKMSTSTLLWLDSAWYLLNQWYIRKDKVLSPNRSVVSHTCVQNHQAYQGDANLRGTRFHLERHISFYKLERLLEGFVDHVYVSKCKSVCVKRLSTLTFCQVLKHKETCTQCAACACLRCAFGEDVQNLYLGAE